MIRTFFSSCIYSRSFRKTCGNLSWLGKVTHLLPVQSDIDGRLQFLTDMLSLHLRDEILLKMKAALSEEHRGLQVAWWMALLTASSLMLSHYPSSHTFLCFSFTSPFCPCSSLYSLFVYFSFFRLVRPKLPTQHLISH